MQGKRKGGSVRVRADAHVPPIIEHFRWVYDLPVGNVDLLLLVDAERGRGPRRARGPEAGRLLLSPDGDHEEVPLLPREDDRGGLLALVDLDAGEAPTVGDLLLERLHAGDGGLAAAGGEGEGEGGGAHGELLPLGKKPEASNEMSLL